MPDLRGDQGTGTASGPIGRLFRFVANGLRMQHLLFLGMLTVAAVPLAALDYWESRNSFRNEMDSVRERHLLVARNLTSTLSRYVIDVKAAFEVTLSSGALEHDVPGLIELLRSLDFLHVCVIGADGKIELAPLGLQLDSNKFATAQVRVELRQMADGKGSEPLLSELKHDPAGRPVFYLVKNLGNGQLGLASFSTAYLVRLQQAVAFGKNGHAVIVDGIGQVIAHPIKEWEKASKDLSGIEIVQAMIRGETGVQEFYSPAFSGNMIAGFATVPESGWGVMVPQPIAELRERAREINSRASVVSAIALAAAVLLSWVLAWLIARPIRSVASTADAILAGDETAEVAIFSGLVPREIRLLGSAFNTMVQGLRRRNAETRLALEHADLSNRAKSQFLANMSHEIRTPLNGMLGMAELLRQTSLTPTQQHYTDTMARSGSVLISLVNDVLDLSKIEAGMLELDLARFDLMAVVQDTVELFAEAAKAKGLALETSLPASPELALIGDPLRLRQILVNLLGNAIKFTRAGTIRLAVATQASDDAGTLRIRFDVSDTGIGIAPEKLSMIFDAFTQADGSTTREYGGTGLGLSIARQICAAMAGEITAQSEPGKGSVFTVVIPFRKAEGQVATVSVPAAMDGDRRIRVLLAEDNAMNMEVARALLQNLGCDVTVAADGIELVEIYKAQSFDLAFVDLQMPRMDGLAAVREIRQYEKTAGIHTPIVACSAHALPGDRAKSLAAGMDDHVTKPITRAVLAAAVENWVRRDGARRVLATSAA
jgi:signal transduction histidine kinase/CheY-like chemotaxis protein